MDYQGLTDKLLNSPASGTENSDPLMNRMEDKYLVSRSFLEKLTSRLRENLKDGESDTHVRFNFSNTIYLDTQDLDCFRDAAAGIKPRFKVRIRHYAPNGGKFEEVAYLELKIKTEEGLTKKTRIRIPQDLVPGIAKGIFTITGTDELVNLNRDIPPNILMNRIHTINSTLKKYGFRQQIVICYERRAYANDQIRVTVDDHIQYFDAAKLGDAKELVQDAPGFGKMEKLADRVKNTPYVILEVKHRGIVPTWLEDLMKEVKAERVKFSKYATAIVDFCKNGTNFGDISKQGLDIQPLMALFHEPVAKGKKSKDLANIAYVVLRDKNFVLVGKRKNNDKWGLPGGRFEDGEDKEDVALRELKEETDIKLGKGELTYEGKKIVETDDEIKTVYIFSGKHPGGEPKAKDDEFHSWEWMRCENGMLPAKILEEKMNGPTEAAFEKMGLTKGETMSESNVISLMDKLRKGGPGSGVQGHVTAKQPSPLHPQVGAEPAKPTNKLQTHLQMLEHGKVMPGMKTGSGKPVVNDMETARAQGYDVQDHVDAMNAHFELAEKTKKMLEKFKLAGHKVPTEGEKIARFHGKKMKEHMAARQYLENRKEHTAQAIKDKGAKAVASVKKAATTQMGGGLGDRDLDIGAYAQAHGHAHREWLEKLYLGMSDFSFGDLPRSFECEKGAIHLSKVDDGLYSGYFTNKENGLEDNARVRIERITLPELVQLMTAKEWISPIFYEPKITPEIQKDGFNEGGGDIMMSQSEPSPEQPMIDLTNKLQAQPEHPLDRKIQFLELISKLLG